MSGKRSSLRFRYSVRVLLLFSVLFAILFGSIAWRVNRTRKQQLAINQLKQKGAFLYQKEYDSIAILYAKLTGSWAHGDVSELVLSHDVTKPISVDFDPKDIDLLKDFPCLKRLEIFSSQRDETIARLVEIDSLNFVGLYMNDPNDAGVATLRTMRPDLKIRTK